MREQHLSSACSIPTDLPGLRLVALTVDHAQPYYHLIDQNRDHLTQHGDYLEMQQATLASVTADLSDPSDTNHRFGIWRHDTLIGRVDLVPRGIGHLVIGYWLGGAHTGKGYATSACRAVLQYGCTHLGATAVFAGVTKGNHKSEALLHRLGFAPIEDRGTYTLFRFVNFKSLH